MRLMLTEAALLRRDRQQRRHPGHCNHGPQMKDAIDGKKMESERNVVEKGRNEERPQERGRRRVR